jgi:hypothetical protein
MEEVILRSLGQRHALSRIIAILVPIAPPRYIRSRHTKPFWRFGCFLNAFLSGYDTTFARKRIPRTCCLGHTSCGSVTSWVSGHPCPTRPSLVSRLPPESQLRGSGARSGCLRAAR